MFYQNTFYDIFNQPYIETQIRKQHYQDQIMKSADCVKKLDDFLTSVEKVEPEYQKRTMEACCSVIIEHMKNYGNNWI